MFDFFLYRWVVMVRVGSFLVCVFMIFLRVCGLSGIRWMRRYDWCEFSDRFLKSREYLKDSKGDLE